MGTGQQHSTAQPGVVQLWRLPLSRSPDELKELLRCLSPDEVERADNFRFEVHRQRFIAGRAGLRQVLAGYLGCVADGVEFQYSEHGKPLLAGQSSEEPMQFNLAHSEDDALVAVTLGSRLGVDLERLRTLDLPGVARSAFSESECRELFSLESAEQPAAFFRAWTRKEAVLKALGTGFSLPSQSFDVALGPGVAPRLISVPAGAQPATSWTLLDIPVGDGFAGAVAVEYPAAGVVLMGLPNFPSGLPQG